MGYLYFKVDEKAIKEKLKNDLAARPDVQDRATRIVANLFARAHESLMREYWEHPITQELKQGNGAANISMTLGGYGNLFTFLGFWVGQDPTVEIEELLQQIGFKRTSHRNGIINFEIINLPTKRSIKEASRLNWGNGSWATAVEDGDFQGGADLAHFIYKSWGGARSQQGFQIKGYEYSEEQFSPKPYLSEILANFAERVNGSRSKFLV